MDIKKTANYDGMFFYYLKIVIYQLCIFSIHYATFVLGLPICINPPTEPRASVEVKTELCVRSFEIFYYLFTWNSISLPPSVTLKTYPSTNHAYSIIIIEKI